MLSTREANACDYFFATLPQIAASPPVLAKNFQDSGCLKSTVILILKRGKFLSAG
jgi:hypothetical protein